MFDALRQRIIRHAYIIVVKCVTFLLKQQSDFIFKGIDGHINHNRWVFPVIPLTSQKRSASIAKTVPVFPRRKRRADVPMMDPEEGGLRPTGE